MTILTPVRRMAVAAAVLAAMAVLTPQAAGADKPAVKVAQSANTQTKAYALANPEVVSVAATVCGSGYELSSVTPLPKGTDPKLRHATVFSYTKGGNDSGCSIMDNNLGSAQHMKLKVCNVRNTACDTDEGTFSQYAGPVYTSQPVCAHVTAQMWYEGTLYINYKSDYEYLCD
ncbi:hypothetical protein [Streptomyces botrytidirepellens]|uniref:Uncharacterized protein n=1 Tax=Streptomyces botrytidirepellens TaxID=2486417 RepID=A0A3M8WN69_9ACTN|nr:hypothetical protein [Streptomyces botrytidirepellens]RNG30409.1 hypothetical protein EEJ42_10650 [Streptomyces botrytidirepellens]